MESDNIIAELRRAFGNKCSDMFKIDGLMAALCKRPVFDIHKLEKWCYADGMDDDASMEEYLTKRFGDKHYKLILKALALE